MHRSIVVAFALSSLTVAQGVAQAPVHDVDTAAFAGLKWRNIGPYRSGRSVAVAGSVARPLEYYSGTTGGGVMKTTNGGYTWEPVTDKFFGGTIGGIAIYPPNPDIVYVGTGESTLRGNASYGDGVYKTTDGGSSWTFLGLRETRQIARVVVHPWNPDLVYVAALGHAHGPNPERGVFRSKDGGKTWEKILFRNDSTGATDLQMDPGDPNVLYASTWQVVRKPWDIVSGGAGSAIYKTTDGGDHWTELTHNEGLPKGVLGNIGLAVSPANPERVWAMIEADSGGLYRSENGGVSWKRINAKSSIHWRPFYFSRVFADPADTNTVYLPNGTLFRSTDGGLHFSEVRPYNDLWDTHVLWIAPDNRDRMIVGADQGARISVNRGANWSTTGYPTGQFYHITASNHFPYRVCGSQQDNSSSCGPSRSDNLFDITQWYYAGGGEAGVIIPDPNRPDRVFATGGGNTRYDRATGFFDSIDPWWEPPARPKDQKQRWNWTTPMALSPHDSRVVYLGSNMLFKSADRGATWSIISPDLTRHDPKTLIVAGGPITVEATGAETYATIFAIAESPVASGTIWVGSDDGMIHLTRDGGAHWTDVTPREGWKEFSRVSTIEPSPHAAGTAYVAANRNMLDDYAPYLFKTTDYGRTWTRITDGIPSDEFARVIREDPERKGLLYAGTERGVWVSFDDGGHWQSLRRNLPPVPVHDIVVKEGDLAIATHGRAFWILDDISPLRQMARGTTEQAVHLFTPRDAYRVFWGGGALIENLQAGQNPPNGVFIYYWLKDKNQEVSLDILDASGTTVNHFTSRPDSATLADSLRLETKKQARNDSLKAAGITDSARLAAPYVEPTPDEEPNKLGSLPRLPDTQGLNLFNWTFNYAAGVALIDTTFQLRRVPGGTALPGAYQVRLTVGGHAETARFTLKPDPRRSTGPADWRARLDQSRRVYAAMTEVFEAINGLATVRGNAEARLAGSGGNAAVTAALTGLRDSLGALARRLSTPRTTGFDFDPYTTSALGEITQFSYGDMNTAPSQAERTGSVEALARAGKTLVEVRSAARAAVQSANRALQSAGQPTLELPVALSRMP